MRNYIVFIAIYERIAFLSSVGRCVNSECKNYRTNAIERRQVVDSLKYLRNNKNVIKNGVIFNDNVNKDFVREKAPISHPRSEHSAATMANDFPLHI